MKYKLFPIPQDLVYDEGTISLLPKVNLIMDQNLDQYTKNRVLGILKEFQIGFETNTQISAEMINIIIRISKHPSHHYDGYKLMITESKIQLFGDNTDAVFYGLATLRQILKQSQGLKVQQLAIRDYADVKNRGFIEGYYGNPWSDADRINLMRFGSDLKLTQYVFAPKDDPYHNEKWRELYPQKRLNKIKKLAQVGNETKTKFVWTLHPFMHDPIRFDRNYISDLRIIEKKFDQLMLVGVREFGILADDAPWPKHGMMTILS
ncbi:beta-N-acetylglucosaminidase domain-containing protein [Companilactobacillus kimchii]|uniref:beta-N-acetylglucosaminidase domain-containing protein n=1 Tax=Companilactobacillus kimchii TaxID=2801452 RepID=UPI0006D08342|nr:beta-N-acetylglucosaminidase domain-containing protein [Companilactobacillus kimchii]